MMRAFTGSGFAIPSTPSQVLHHVVIQDDDSASAPVDERPIMLILHGILGSGSNWKTFASRLISARPDWRAVLVDLRMHGRSQGLTPPHTVEACARDLLALQSQLQESTRGPVRAVLGHSFGSKVATVYSSLRARGGDPLESLWLIDGDPGAHRPKPESLRGDDVDRVLAALDQLPDRFSSRDDFIDALVAEGLSRPVAAWLATNLERREGSEPFRFRLDLGAIRALLADYRATDAWPLLESDPARRQLVVGGRSAVVPPESQDRFESSVGKGQLHCLPTAGHWVHVDDLEGLVRLVAPSLTAT